MIDIDCDHCGDTGPHRVIQDDDRKRVVWECRECRRTATAPMR